MSTEVDALISRVYYSPATGFQGAQRVLGHIRRLHPTSNVNLKQVSDFISRQEVAQIHRQVPKQKVFRHILAQLLDEHWQADLIDLPRLEKSNNGYRYILVVIDIFSRFLWTIPLKNKTGGAVAQAFRQLLGEGRYPGILTTDNGKEFLNKDVLRVLKENNITHKVNFPGDHGHLGIVERANKTIKTQLFKYSTATRNDNWFNVINDIVDGYNKTFHSTTKRRPVDVVAGTQRPVGQEQPELVRIPLGTKVRIIVNQKQFAKGYEARFSRALYNVVQYSGNRYVLKLGVNLQKRTYKKNELQAVDTVERTPRGVKEIASLQNTALQIPTTKRVPKKKVRE